MTSISPKSPEAKPRAPCIPDTQEFAAPARPSSRAHQGAFGCPGSRGLSGRTFGLPVSGPICRFCRFVSRWIWALLTWLFTWSRLAAEKFRRARHSRGTRQAKGNRPTGQIRKRKSSRNRALSLIAQELYGRVHGASVPPYVMASAAVDDQGA